MYLNYQRNRKKRTSCESNYTPLAVCTFLWSVLANTEIEKEQDNHHLLFSNLIWHTLKHASLCYRPVVILP